MMRRHRCRTAISARRCGCRGRNILLKLLLTLAVVLLPSQYFVAADGLLANLAYQLNDRLFPPEDYINDGINLETKSLNIIQISEMRVRDIKRRLAREHGYSADELARMRPLIRAAALWLSEQDANAEERVRMGRGIGTIQTVRHKSGRGRGSRGRGIRRRLSS